MQQEVAGQLASGGSFRATNETIEVFDSAGAVVGTFSIREFRDIERDGSTVTLRRINGGDVAITTSTPNAATNLEDGLRSWMEPPVAAQPTTTSLVRIEAPSAVAAPTASSIVLAQQSAENALLSQAPSAISNTVVTNVTVQHTVLVDAPRQGHGCFITALWFVFIGWWASAIWLAIAWFLTIIIITLPIGLMMINKVPKIVSLKDPSRELTVSVEGMVTRISHTELSQRPFWMRGLYFVGIGWWASFVWMYAAWFASITLIGLPLAIWMYNRVPAVTTLKRY